MKNALFFDIDGTLINEHGDIPESAYRAIEKTRKNGNLVFINSGRCMGMLKNIQRMIEVDGYLAGCGTEIIYEGERIHYYLMPENEKKELKEASDRYNVDLIIEGNRGVYYHTDVEHSRFPIMTDVKELAIGSGCEIFEEGDEYEASKFCIQSDDTSDVPAFEKQFSDRYVMLDRHNGFYEAAPIGMDKGTAIDVVLDKLGIDKKHAFVFGDSTNDLAMFKCGANTIAMEKHDSELDRYADYITTDIENDGIKNAMEHFGLI
jgi:Cof subfamily protein (haloacid dehalogenase superfamily)